MKETIKEIALDFLRFIRYLIMFNPISMVLFCIFPTIESRRGLFRYKLKELFLMKLNQVKKFFMSFISPFSKDFDSSYHVCASYLGKNKLSVYLTELEKSALEKTFYRKVICFTNSEKKLLFNCSIIHGGENKHIYLHINCFSPKTKKIISDPNNRWFFSFY